MVDNTHVNFLSGSPLNRASWLRNSSRFLQMAVHAPDTRWIVLKNGQPLVRTDPASRKRSVERVPTAAVRSLLGEDVCFGQGETHGQRAEASVSVVEGCRLRGPVVVFLGLREPDGAQALPSSEFRNPETVEGLSGAPYFSVDLSELAEGESADFVASVRHDRGVVEFAEPRSAMQTFDMEEAAIFSVARSMVDWNVRNKFCPACGSPTYSLWGGWKRACSTLLPWAPPRTPPCPSGKGLNNYMHPRTDPVVIMAVLDAADESRILLGRNAKFPGGFFSTLAGFCEPSESFEDAVTREIWEEAGVRVRNVRYHSSQPWPFPANLMVGCYAYADPSQTIRVDLDNELAEARWFTREEVRAVLQHPQGTTMRPQEYKRFDDETNGVRSQAGKDEGEVDAPPFRVPPRSAIAGVLISDWVNGKLGTRGADEGPLRGKI